MKPYDINDFVIPMQIVKQGFRGILEKMAFCKEETAEEIKGEFNRQIRITTRTLRAMFNYKTLLNPFNYPVFSFEIVSHKLMKFMTPFWMILIFIANVYLAGSGILFYQSALALQTLFYLCAFIGFLKKKANGKGRLFDLSRSYLLINLAYALGWYKFLSKETYTFWLPKR
jgi:hypothetical protein